MSSSSISAFRYLAATGVLVTGAVAAFVIAVLATSGTPPGHPGQYWTAYLTLQKRDLARAEKRPRLLVFGGSDVLFSIRAETLSRVTSLPAFNMGVHAGNGIPMILNEATNEAHEGDTILVLPVRTNLEAPQQPVTRHAAAVTYAMDNRILKSGSFRERLSLLSHIGIHDIYLSILNRGTRYQPGKGNYWIYPLLPAGDFPEIEGSTKLLRRVIAQTGIAPNIDSPPPLEPIPGKYSILTGLRRVFADYGPIDPAIASSIQRSVKNIEDKGATIYFAIPPSIFAVHPDIKKALVDLVGKHFLETDADSRLPFEMALDTPYHANAAGRKLATARIAKAICAEMASCESAALADAERVSHAYPALAAMIETANFGEIVAPFPDTLLPAGRWAYGPQASLSVFTPAGCRNSLRVEGRANPSMQRMVSATDSTHTGSFEFRAGVFESLSIPLPSDNQIHGITLKFDGRRVTDSVKPALLVRRIQRVSDCRPLEPA